MRCAGDWGVLGPARSSAHFAYACKQIRQTDDCPVHRVQRKSYAVLSWFGVAVSARCYCGGQADCRNHKRNYPGNNRPAQPEFQAVERHEQGAESENTEPEDPAGQPQDSKRQSFHLPEHAWDYITPAQ